MVVGGGPAGAATAITLTQHGHRPVVVEAATDAQHKVGESLPPSANPVIERLGLVDGVCRAGRPSYGNRSLWGSATPLDRDFVFGTAGAGWSLDRDRFEDELRAAAVRAGVDWRAGHRLVGCARRAPVGWTLTLDTPRGRRSCTADFVVDASGRAARFARLLGVRRVRYDNLVAVAGTYRTARAGTAPELSTALLVEATPLGWCYSLALPDDQLIVVHLTDGDLLDREALRRPGAVSPLLASAPATLARLDRHGGEPAGPVRIRPAHTSRLDALAGRDWLAVGDAAATHDPLASYGIVAALGSGLYAGAAATAALGGDADALPPYLRTVDGAFARYLVLHHDHYRAEQRWTDSPFWERRHRRRHEDAGHPPGAG